MEWLWLFFMFMEREKVHDCLPCSNWKIKNKVQTGVSVPSSQYSSFCTRIRLQKLPRPARWIKIGCTWSQNAYNNQKCEFCGQQSIEWRVFFDCLQFAMKNSNRDMIDAPAFKANGTDSTFCFFVFYCISSTSYGIIVFPSFFVSNLIFPFPFRVILLSS